MHAPYDNRDTPSPSARFAAGGTPVVLDRREGPHGEVVLRRQGEVLQIIANGCFLMDTSDGRSERLLVDAALDALDGRPAPAVLIGGLGVGFSLAHAAANPRWGAITVVEREEAVINWHGLHGGTGRAGPPTARRPGPAPGPGTPSAQAPAAAPFAALTAAALADPRTVVVHADLVAHVHASRAVHDALCLDIDNGPGWTVTEDNDGLYSPAGLAACRARLTPGGVLAVWSAKPSPDFEETLRNAGFRGVHTKEIPVARGVPDVVHLAVRPG
ncbi:spermidine synthase [Streptomyces sulfonofaciens]|uniref:Spermidine synthase n=1 Tax=Streptomyces sulfonofaciens TaxID=68272 RepID=A0A919GC91_9ACTN|nr:spermidine synthase [Streptomyces sulfonofaciens]GHH81846.1 spermidine synthase [Streptomyces sulfonofaciens]